MLHKENKSCYVIGLVFLSFSLSMDLNSSRHLPWSLFELFLPPMMVLFSLSSNSSYFGPFFFSFQALPTLVLFSLSAPLTLIFISFLEFLMFKSFSISLNFSCYLCSPFFLSPQAYVRTPLITLPNPFFFLLELDLDVKLLPTLVLFYLSSSLSLNSSCYLPWSFSLSLQA
jgi:hypothetical protein